MQLSFRNTILTVLISLASGSFLTLMAQDKMHPCASSKIPSHFAKSASLTPGQIAETEKYDVHHYKLDLEMTHTSTFISGVVTLSAKTRVALDTVLLELFPGLNIQNVKRNGQTVAFTRSGSAIKIPANFGALVNFSVSVQYSGTPPTAATNPLGGSGLSNRSSPSWGNQVTWSLSQPFSAYEWWPCKQSLKDKIDSLDVHLTVPSICKAGSNGLLKNVVDLGNGKTRYEWKHKHKISYYLVSVSVAKYVEYNFWAHPENSDSIFIQNFIYDNPATLAQFEQDIARTGDFLEAFSKRYGPYPFPKEKYGHCMAPLSGGMEHQTMTTQGSFNNGLTAHELAHQWFGDFVTCRSWADLWVNEGFATYSEYVMLQDLFPSEAAADMLGIHNSVLSQPGGSVWIEDSLNANRLFSSRLTYNKGAGFLHTLRYLVGNDSLFFQGLRNYLTRFGDSTALGTDVQAELENVSGKSLSSAFEEWYFGEGFPTYSVRWNSTDGNLHIRINQSVSMPAVTPFFSTPLPVRIRRTGRPDTTIVVPISGLITDYFVGNTGNVTSVLSVDPDNWLMNRQGTITKDISLVFTSIGEKQTGNNPVFQVFPNPGNGVFKMQQNFGEKSILKVVDPLGRCLLEKEVGTAEELDLRNHPNGSYVLFLTHPDGKQKTVRQIRKK